MVPGWRQRAACKGKWLLFLATFGARSSSPSVQEAKAVCRGCEVRAWCLREHFDERDGVWGGLTGRERRRLGRKLAVLQAPPYIVATEETTRGARSA